MSNEEMATRIQQGERDLLPMLWTQVERFVSQQAGRVARSLARAAPVTQEDLFQSGYLALVAAVETYDPARGMAFIGYLALHLKTAFAEAGGYRSTKQRLDPLNMADSLDRPIGDVDGGTLADTVVDPESGAGFEEVAEQLWREQLHADLDKALDILPESEGDALRRRFFRNETLEDISRTTGVGMEIIRQQQNNGLRALRNPKISKGLRQYMEAHTNYFMHVGGCRFNTTGSSAVEELAIRREELAVKWQKSSS